MEVIFFKHWKSNRAHPNTSNGHHVGFSTFGAEQCVENTVQENIPVCIRSCKRRRLGIFTNLRLVNVLLLWPYDTKTELITVYIDKTIIMSHFSINFRIHTSLPNGHSMLGKGLFPEKRKIKASDSDSRIKGSWKKTIWFQSIFVLPTLCRLTQS